MKTFAHALAAQGRVIGALFQRDIRSRGGEPVADIYIFLEPIFITLIVLALHWGTGGTVNTVPVVAFVLTGFPPHLLLRHSGLAGLRALNANVGLLYHRRIHHLDLVMARLLAEIAFIITANIAIYCVFHLLGLFDVPASIGYFLFGWLLHIWFVIVCCFIFTGLALIWPISRRFFLPICLLFLPIYGAFSMLSWWPTPVRNFLLWFPPANATEIMRRGYFGLTQQTYYDIPYTIYCLTFLTFCGLVILERGRRRLEV